MTYSQKLNKRAIAAIEMHKWSAEPLTQYEKYLIGMAVSWTYATLKVEGFGTQPWWDTYEQK